MRKSIILSFVLITGLIIGSCSNSHENKEKQSVKPRQDINIVKDAHTGELMKIPGVVGVYVGEMENGTPFICVMVDKLTKELRQRIPTELDGYPIQVEETGKIELR